MIILNKGMFSYIGGIVMKKTLRVLSMFLALMMLMMSCGLAEVLRYGKEGDEVAKLQAALTELKTEFVAAE